MKTSLKWKFGFSVLKELRTLCVGTWKTISVVLSSSSRMKSSSMKISLSTKFSAEKDSLELSRNLWKCYGIVQRM